jgi:hypothetical protein
MMRIARILAFSVLAGGLTLSAANSEGVTYVDGNLTGFVPNSGGTLLLTGDQAIELRAGQATVAVPYAGITKAELGAIKVHSHGEPLYKVWALHKRFVGKTESQLVTVSFKDEDGDQKNMTLELDKLAAADVVAAIHNHNGTGPAANAPRAGEWWGDSYWRTTRNAGKWDRNGSLATR